jgi:multidrug resistance efflux pump
MINDPIVEEVRAIREKLAAQFDFDIRRIVEDAQRRQALSQGRIVSFERLDPPRQQSGLDRFLTNPSDGAKPTRASAH